MYNFYKDSGEKASTFYILKTYVVTTGATYEKDETKDFPDLFNQSDLKNKSIEWFEEKFREEYSHIDKFEYRFVEIKISDDFNAATITCPKKEEWEMLPKV